MSEFRPCALVPTYDNPRTIRAVVGRLREHLPDVIVVDDGSGPEGERAAAALEAEGLARVVRRAQNGGKGAAVKDGFARARELGFSHAVQVDADGQHDLSDLPEFIEKSRGNPGALILGEPRFDASAPRARLWARKITLFWTHIETLGRVIGDPMCGFRVYPLAQVARVECAGDRMDFDIEIAVRMAWAKTPIINLPTRVRYVPAAEGGVSHFRLVRDNVAISLMHTRLVLRLLAGLLTGGHRRLGP